MGRLYTTYYVPEGAPAAEVHSEAVRRLGAAPSDPTLRIQKIKGKAGQLVTDQGVRLRQYKASVRQ